jgi:hypothetical protein
MFAMVFTSGLISFALSPRISRTGPTMKGMATKAAKKPTAPLKGSTTIFFTDDDMFLPRKKVGKQEHTEAEQNWPGGKRHVQEICGQIPTQTW